MSPNEQMGQTKAGPAKILIFGIMLALTSPTMPRTKLLLMLLCALALGACQETNDLPNNLHSPNGLNEGSGNYPAGTRNLGLPTDKPGSPPNIYGTTNTSTNGTGQAPTPTLPTLADFKNANWICALPSNVSNHIITQDADDTMLLLTAINSADAYKVTHGSIDAFQIEVNVDRSNVKDKLVFKQNDVEVDDDEDPPMVEELGLIILKTRSTLKNTRSNNSFNAEIEFLMDGEEGDEIEHIYCYPVDEDGNAIQIQTTTTTTSTSSETIGFI